MVRYLTKKEKERIKNENEENKAKKAHREVFLGTESIFGEGEIL